MDGTEFRFGVGQRVRLRDGVDSGFYSGMAKVGNEGWIKGHRRDRFGLPEVYIAWDPNHWAYNRQPDQWTFQEHFDPVEETRSVSDQNNDKKEVVLQALSALADQLVAALTDTPESAPEAAAASAIPTADPNLPRETQEPSDQERYAAFVQEAAQAMVESEAFVCVTITRHPDDRAPQGMLTTGVIGDTLTAESEMLLGARLAALGAEFHQNAAALHIRQIAEERDRRERAQNARPEA